MEIKLSAVIKFPDPILAQRATEIDCIGLDALEWLPVAEQMLKIMEAEHGIGLAGPQVGIPKRIFVAQMTDYPLVAINPVLRFTDDAQMATSVEGCLSVPGFQAEVARPDKVLLSGLIIRPNIGTMVVETISLGGINARVVQHETDHLDGVMFFQRISEEDRQAVIRHVAGIKRKVRTSK